MGTAEMNVKQLDHFTGEHTTQLLWLNYKNKVIQLVIYDQIILLPHK